MMWNRISSIFVVFLLFFFGALNDWAQSLQHTVPLPDDQPSQAAAAPEKRPHDSTAPSVLPVHGSGAVSISDGWKQTATLSGIKVDFRIVPSLKDIVLKRGPVPVSLNQVAAAEMVEGEQAILQFRFTDPAGTPLSGLRIASWLDQMQGDKPADPKMCHDKIQSFLQMQLSARPEVDLNTYFVLALTREPAILVIDPRVGFSTSKLYAMVDLAAPGMDWALSGNNERLFVSMPAVHQVAVIDTLNFRLLGNVAAGEDPMRVALQPDGKYLWVGNDARENSSESGVIAIDTTTLQVAARIPTGKGHHEIVFDEVQTAYVTNQESGTVSIINTQTLTLLQHVAVGKEPVALAYSPRSRMVYVTSYGDGTVTALSSENHKVAAKLIGQPGLRALQISPDGRWGFVANELQNSVAVFDTSSNIFKESYSVGHAPDQLGSTVEYIYVRSRDSEEITLIPLAGAGKHGTPATFPAGQVPPGKTAGVLAPVIAPSLDGASAFVANPADRRIYYYQEGMAAPMVSLEGYGKTPTSALVLDRSIHETTAGIYSVGLTLPKAGNYDVPLFVDSPALSHCFDLAIKINPLLKKMPDVAVYLRPLKNNLQVRTGEPVEVAFRLVDSGDGKPRNELNDVEITVLLAEGLRQMHFQAESSGEGVYHFTFTPPKDGVYYVMVSIPSLKIRSNQLPYLMVRAGVQQTTEAKPVKGSE
jgi:YVTN family beta-propeller protein